MNFKTAMADEGFETFPALAPVPLLPDSCMHC